MKSLHAFDSSGFVICVRKLGIHSRLVVVEGSAEVSKLPRRQQEKIRKLSPHSTVITRKADSQQQRDLLQGFTAYRLVALARVKKKILNKTPVKIDRNAFFFAVIMHHPDNLHIFTFLVFGKIKAKV